MWVFLSLHFGMILEACVMGRTQVGSHEKNICLPLINLMIISPLLFFFLKMFIKNILIDNITDIF
jgi:hypothetical protein